jgi:hypothetical protein
MSEQPIDLTHELLRQIRAEMSDFRFAVDRRFDALETDMREVKQTLRLTSMMATSTGRLEDLETRMDRLPPG